MYISYFLSLCYALKVNQAVFQIVAEEIILPGHFILFLFVIPTQPPGLVTSVIYVKIVLVNQLLNEGKEGHVLFNDTLNTFYLRLYGVGHMTNDNSDS